MPSDSHFRERVLHAPASNGVPKRVASLVITYARAKMLQQEFRKEDRRLARQDSARNHSRSLPDLFRLWSFFNLWLAYLHVVVEGWDEALLHDDRIYRLLKGGYRARLKAFRNAVFHANAYNDERLLKLYEEHEEVRRWADQLMKAFGQFFTDYLAGSA